ncbi:MAG: CoA-binding protein [Gammaproteobacteria bacterium]|nr:CoA-binding protein [Gammaproteobacteria bacterium]
MPDIPMLRRILREHRRIAVVGLSADWYRPSFFAAKYMQSHGYQIIPVNPRHREILGETSYPDLAAAAEAAGPVDIVDVFRRPDSAPPLAREAAAIGAKVLWLQLGIVSAEAAQIAAAAGLEVVMDRCVKIEHARLFGGLNFVGVNTRVISAHRHKIITN